MNPRPVSGGNRGAQAVVFPGCTLGLRLLAGPDPQALINYRPSLSTRRADTRLNNPPYHPRVGLTPGTWLIVTVRPSGRRNSCAVTAMPPCSACRRSSWISCERARGQHRPWPPRRTETSLHGETPVGHQGAEARHHGVPQALSVSEMNHITLTLTPSLEPAGRDHHAGVCGTGRACQPSHCCSQPSPAHSPGACGVRPGSSFEGPLSSDPALHLSLPACSWVTQHREAPAEGKGPKLLTARPSFIRPLSFTFTIFLPQMDPGTPELGSHGRDGTWKVPSPHPSRLVCLSLGLLRGSGQGLIPGPSAPSSGVPLPRALQGAPLARQPAEQE